MLLPSPEPAVRRVAELHLRGAAGPLPARVLWPDVPGRPGLLVLCPDAADPAGASTDLLARALCAGAGLIVIRPLRVPSRAEATATLEWAAEHGAQLGADAGRLVLGGCGAGGGLAAAVALDARDGAWPPLARQLLVLPAFDDGEALPDLAGVAPATVVSGPDGDFGRRHAARLQAAGVAVQELDAGAPGLLAALTRSLAEEVPA